MPLKTTQRGKQRLIFALDPNFEWWAQKIFYLLGLSQPFRGEDRLKNPQKLLNRANLTN